MAIFSKTSRTRGWPDTSPPALESDGARGGFRTAGSLSLLLVASTSVACSATASSGASSQGGGGAGNTGGTTIMLPGGNGGSSINNPPPVIMNATPFVADDTGNSGLGPDVVQKLKAGGAA